MSLRSETACALVAALAAAAAFSGEPYLGTLDWRAPAVPREGTREHAAVAAAYSLRGPAVTNLFASGWDIVRAVYGRDYSGAVDPRLVVLACEADSAPEIRGRKIQALLDCLRPGDVVATVGTSGVSRAVFYAGDVYGDRHGKVLAVNRSGRVCERGYGSVLIDWPLLDILKLRRPVAFRLIRPLADGAVSPVARGEFPRGEIQRSDDENVRAALAYAWGSYMKGPAIQYDSINVVGPEVWKRHSARWGRCDYHGSLVSATADRTRHTVCSSFAYEAFWELFGYGIGDGGSGHLSYDLTGRPPSDILVYSYDRKRNSKDKAEVINEIRRVLRPGDVINYAYVYRKKRSGHVMLYVGEVDGIPTILHSTGQKYVFPDGYDKTELEGTMAKDDVETTLLTPGEPRYLMKFDQVSVLRPILHAGLGLTPFGAAMAKHPKFRYDRRVKGGDFGSVVTGGELQYGIEVFNADREPCDATVVETLPKGTELVSASAGCQVEGRTLKWPLSLAAGESRIVNWKVRVTARPGARIVSDGGSAGGIPSNRLTTEVVARTVTADEALAWAEGNVVHGRPLPQCRVRGWGGGYRSATPGRRVRVMETRSRDLMPGDVVLSIPKRGKDESWRVWAKGRDGLVTKNGDGKVVPVPEREVVALLACDFFAAFRPAADVRSGEPTAADNSGGVKNHDGR